MFQLQKEELGDQQKIVFEESDEIKLEKLINKHQNLNIQKSFDHVEEITI